MSDHLKFYINGEWVDPLGSETIEVINPSDESIIGSSRYRTNNRFVRWINNFYSF